MKYLRQTIPKVGDNLILRLKTNKIQYITIEESNVFIDLVFKTKSEAQEAVNSIIADNTLHQQQTRIDMPSPCSMALEELK